MGALQRFLSAVGLGQTADRAIRSKANESLATVEAVSTTQTEMTTLEAPKSAMPFDPCLLDRAHTQYHFGDWDSLAQINVENLRHQPDRATLSVLAAAGRLQTGKKVEAREYLRLAQDWGANKTFISRILISNVYNSLGRAAAISDQPSRALQNFYRSIVNGMPSHDAKLLVQARAMEQLKQIGTLGIRELTETIDSAGPSIGRQGRYALSKRSETPTQRKYVDFSSRKYWEERYIRGGTSGFGSYGRLAEFKARVINKFIEDESIDQVIEFGCGDGNQLSMLHVKNYVGVDISPTIIGKCKARFTDDVAKLFLTNEVYLGSPLKTTLTLSLDVIFHLIEDDVFENYMSMLFDAAERYCIIYACDEDWRESDPTHIRRRKFTKWIADNLREWRLMQVTYNKYPYFGFGNPENLSFSNFYFYERM